MTLRILHLEDSADDAELVCLTLKREGIDFHVHRVASKVAFEAALAAATYSIILSDFSLPAFDGLAALELAQKIAPETPFLFLSGTIGEDRAVESLKCGAADYILKDRLQRLAPAILRAHEDALKRKQQLADQEQIRRQAELLNQAKDAIFIRNLNQEIIYWNNSAVRIYGWTADEIVGKSAAEMLYKPGSGSREEVWKSVLEKGEWTGELAQVTKAGRQIIVSSHRTLLRDAAGNPNAVLNINTDVTEKKELESQVLRSQRMDSIGALAGGIAHDLNNMLAPILMATELLQSEIADPDQRRMLDTAKSSAQRGADLVKQILQFSRGGEGLGIVDLRSVEQELVRFIAKTFPPAIRVESDADWDIYPVQGNATQLHQVLLNLCVNARDAMANAGTLRLSVKNRRFSNYLVSGSDQRVSGPFVELTVSDTGPEIPPELRDRIFDPFFTTKPHGKGTGLGLSTVAKIVRDHNGFVEVAAIAGKGATFRVLLPATQPNISTQPKSAAADAPLGHGEWVLLVDDERALLEMTKELLEASNYNVIAASNSAEALLAFKAQREKISVVITDLLMPDIGGQELIANICDRFPETPTICLTGSTDDTTMLHKRVTGATVYLRKPCPTRDLLTALSRLLKRDTPA